MGISEYISVWDALTDDERRILLAASKEKNFQKGEILHNGSADCTGLIIVQSGQLRAFTVSAEGREITLYRLLERDICLFSASCIMNSIQFELTVTAEKDTRAFVIAPEAYKRVMRTSAALANYTNEIMAGRFSDVMWLIDQVIWKSFDKRLAEFLLNEANMDGTHILRITHETIGNHLGNPREVVTRMLRHFQNEGYVKLSRGTVEIIDPQALEELCR